MSRSKRLTAAVLAGLLIVGTPFVLAAKDPDRGGTYRNLTIVEDDGTVTLDFQGNALTITREEGGKTGVTVIDLAEIGSIVGDAMEEVADVLAELQMDIHMGQDNRLNLSVDDKTFELDMDEVFAQIGDALEAGFGEFEAGEWTRTYDRDETERTADELRAELRDLQKEMQDLRRELRRLRADRD